jgi:signal transduction histidine kinase
VVRSVATVFDDMAGRLDELVAAQDAFVADASHQLRNPLTALRLRLENLRADVGDDSDDDLSGALDEVAHLSRLVDGLLVLARAGATAPGPNGPVDLAAAVEDRLAVWSPLADERGVQLVARAGAPARAEATDERVRQVIDNLLANALDAAPAGSEITLAVGTEGDHVVLHVIDAGPGMSDEERARAFDRFWRATTARPGQLGGSGLGLAIVQKLVQADGGDVELAAAPGGGVDAVVRFRHAPRGR